MTADRNDTRRGRAILAATVAAVVLTVGTVAFWPRLDAGSAASSTAIDLHAGHTAHDAATTADSGGSATRSAAPEAVGRLIPPTSPPGAGDSSETSLAEAASRAVGPAARVSGSSSDPTPGGSASPDAGAGDALVVAGGEAAAATQPPPVRRLGKPRPDVSPDDVLGVSGNLGGCLEDYGDSGQCLPTVPPSQAAHVQDMVDAGLDPEAMSHVWSCAEVRLYFPTGIALRDPASDPQRLDEDRDGVGCDPDD